MASTKQKGKRSSRARSGRGSRGNQPSRAARVVAAFREHVGDRRSDAWGLLLVLLAVISALGTWSDAGGPVGAFLDALYHSLVGQFAVFLPLVLGALGAAIVFDRSARELGRIGVGSTLVGVAVIAGWHLLRGAPHVADGVVSLHHAGGLLGFIVSRPLVVGLSLPGAWAVLLFLLALGTLVLTRTSLQAVGRAVRDWFRAGLLARDDEAPAAAQESERAAASPEPEADDAGDPAATTVMAPRRATVSTTGEQDPIPGTEGDGLTEADRLAGRTPAPPRPDEPTSGPRRATPLKPADDWAAYELPSLDMLAGGKAVGERATAHIEAQAAALQETLEQFSIDATVARWSRGPTVTQFEIEPGPGGQEGRQSR